MRRYRPDRLGRVTLTGQVLFTGCSLFKLTIGYLSSGDSGALSLEPALATYMTVGDSE